MWNIICTYYVVHSNLLFRSEFFKSSTSFCFFLVNSDGQLYLQTLLKSSKNMKRKWGKLWSKVLLVRRFCWFGKQFVKAVNGLNQNLVLTFSFTCNVKGNFMVVLVSGIKSKQLFCFLCVCTYFCNAKCGLHNELE